VWRLFVPRKTDFALRPAVNIAREVKALVFAGVLFSALALSACGGGSGGSPGATDAFARGLQAQTAGKFDEATAAYYEVLSKDPKSSAALFNLGLIAHLQNRPIAAESYYRLALEPEPNNAKALFNLAIVRANASGGAQEAVTLYKKVIALLPDYADAHFNLALVLRSLGQTAEAQQAFASAQRLDPNRVAPSASATPARPASPSPKP
jgi:tetratricopeptide (TPR) repeat protein